MVRRWIGRGGILPVDDGVVVVAAVMDAGAGAAAGAAAAVTSRLMVVVGRRMSWLQDVGANIHACSWLLNMVLME